MLYPLVLLLMVLLLVLGGGLLSRQVGHRQAAAAEASALRAQGLAEAGLEDFRLKWERDPQFPPPGDDLERFSYTEALGGGRYEVEVDLRFRLAPTRVLRVTSRGVLGEASSVLVGEFDLVTPPRRPGGRWLGVGGEDARRP